MGVEREKAKENMNIVSSGEEEEEAEHVGVFLKMISVTGGREDLASLILCGQLLQ